MIKSRVYYEILIYKFEIYNGKPVYLCKQKVISLLIDKPLAKSRREN
jgi:hypothetical protein